MELRFLCQILLICHNNTIAKKPSPTTTTTFPKTTTTDAFIESQRAELLELEKSSTLNCNLAKMLKQQLNLNEVQ